MNYYYLKLVLLYVVLVQPDVAMKVVYPEYENLVKTEPHALAPVHEEAEKEIGKKDVTEIELLLLFFLNLN